MSLRPRRNEAAALVVAVEVCVLGEQLVESRPDRGERGPGGDAALLALDESAGVHQPQLSRCAATTTPRARPAGGTHSIRKAVVISAAVRLRPPSDEKP